MKKILLIFSILIVGSFVFLLVGRAPQSEDIRWGVTFSSKYAQDLGLDWQETYSALIDDLGVERMRVVFYWDLIEKEKDVYDFSDLDWKISKAQEKQVEVIPVIGLKVPRWPECHLPQWAKEMEKEEQQEKILELIERTVLRYKDNPTITLWQVENEPFLDFGNCPWYDQEFFIKEVDLVRKIDPERPILVTESGELSFWFKGARIGDLVGTTMYRRTWWHRAGGFYFKYPLTPVHYYRKAWIVSKVFDKEVICAELQAEPWGPAPTYVISLEEQEKSMNPELFKKNIEYARKTGLNEFYLWGAEWWYWMKKKNNQPQFWQEAQKLFE